MLDESSMKTFRLRSWGLLCLLLLNCLTVQAQWVGLEGDTELERLLIGPKLELDDWLIDKRPSLDLAIDINTRIVEKSGGSGTGHLNWIGIDFVDNLTWDGLPLASVIFQAYAIEAKDLPATPIFFDEPRDWQLHWRLVYLDFDRWAHRGISWKVGHLLVPFGLEWITNTNGTLRQYTNAKNLGVKADWGMSGHGTLDGLDYEVALTRGSGNEYRDVDDNHVFAVRIAAHPSRVFSIGVSFLDANLTGQDAPVGMSAFPKPDRVRYGIDGRWTFPRVQWLTELSSGKNDDLEVWSGLIEANLTNSDERDLAYMQVVGSGTKGSSGWDERILVNLGVKRLIGPSLSLEAQWTHDLEVPGNGPLGDTGVLQMRYRF